LESFTAITKRQNKDFQMSNQEKLFSFIS